MDTIKILQEAKSLCTPEKWGRSLSYPGHRLPEGKICAGIALDCATATILGKHDASFAAHDTFRQVIGRRAITEWNDTHSYADVMEAFDRAIQRAEKGE